MYDYRVFRKDVLSEHGLGLLNVRFVWMGRVLRAGLAAAALLGIWLMPGSTQAGGAPFTIRLTTVSDPGKPVSRSIEHFKERVEAESKGAIQIQIIYSSALYTDVQTAPAVSSGAIEMGFVNLARYAGEVPIAELVSVAFPLQLK